jgi:hypothetical protein
LTFTGRWGHYNNAHIDPTPLELAYGHQFLIFTDQLHIGVPIALGGPDNLDSSALVDPSDGSVANVNALRCLEPARIAAGTVFSVGINCVISGSVIPLDGNLDAYDAVANGSYDTEINLWADALLAYKAKGVAQLHAFFQLEPAATNQPAFKGTGPHYKSAFAHVYSMFTSKGVQAAGIKIGWDSDAADWRVPSRAAPRAFDFEPTTYDVCSADFYPTAAATQTFSFGLGDNSGASPHTGFLYNAATNHPTNPVVIRSMCPKTAALGGGGDFTDAQAAAWITDANTQMLAIPNLLGVGWDPNNCGLDLLTTGETYPSYGVTPLAKTAFHNAALSWPNSLGGVVTTISGTNTYSVETTVAAGDTLRFDPNVSTTLIMDNKNLIIYGTLEMKPASASIIHTLRFINVNEEAFVGGSIGGTSMLPVATDIGLWVLDTGVANLHGTPRVGYSRSTSDATWVVGDEMFRGPWTAGDYTTYTAHVQGDTVETLTCPYGHTHTNEVFNLTRNVRIEGQDATHKSHALIMTPGVEQVIEYVAFRYMGPRKATGDSNISAEVRGRWSGVHFHHLDDAYTTVARGCVARDGGSHAFVAHASHGVLFEDCVSYNMNEDVYWWDKEVVSDASHDVTYDHCYSGKVVPIPSFRGTQLSHYLLLKDGGVITDCVGTGNVGGSNSAMMIWPEGGGNFDSTSPGIWENSGNVAHNNKHLGIYIWQNNSNNHEVNDFIAFRNGEHGIRHGAYRNAYDFNDCELFSNVTGDLNLLATNALAIPDQVMFTNVLAETVVIEEHQLLNQTPPIPVQNSAYINDVTVSEFLFDSKGAGPGEYDFIRCGTLDTTDFSIISVGSGATARGMNTASVIRVQRPDNTAFKMTSTLGTDAVFTTIPAFALYVSTSGPSLPGGTVSVAYSLTLASALGVAPVTWALQTGSGALPTGLSLSSTGVISGTPSSAATFSFTVEATDFKGIVAPADFTITTVTSGTPLQIDTATLAGGVVGVAYSATVTASGGTAPRTFSIQSGSLPTGLSLASTGVISGTPTTVQTKSVKIKVTDNVAATANRTYTISVVNLNPTITTTTLPPGEVEVSYGQTIVASGGTSPYVFTSPAVTIPSGLDLSAGGVFTGSPLLAGAYPITVTVTDALALTDTQDYTLTIYQKVTLDPVDPIDTPLGQDYSFDFSNFAHGGSTNYAFAVVGGNSLLAPELTLSDAGVLSGIPTVEGDFSFTLQVTDGLGIATTAVTFTTFC